MTEPYLLVVQNAETWPRTTPGAYGQFWAGIPFSFHGGVQRVRFGALADGCDASRGGGARSDSCVIPRSRALEISLETTSTAGVFDGSDGVAIVRKKMLNRGS